MLSEVFKMKKKIFHNSSANVIRSFFKIEGIVM